MAIPLLLVASHWFHLLVKMAYNYSNPFQQAPSSASRSTFTAASGSSPGYQVIFSGLPLDVSEKDLRVSFFRCCPGLSCLTPCEGSPDQ